MYAGICDWSSLCMFIVLEPLSPLRAFLSLRQNGQNESVEQRMIESKKEVKERWISSHHI